MIEPIEIIRSGEHRAKCIYCCEIPTVIVHSNLDFALGVCGPCAARVCGIFAANATKIAAFERKEKKDRARVARMTGRKDR